MPRELGTAVVQACMTLPAFFEIRKRSLARGNTLVLGSLTLALLLSHYPHIRATAWLFIPALVSLFGTVETVRCIQRRWSFYHAGVLLCIYMDLMAIAMVLFLLLYPYFLWITATH